MKAALSPSKTGFGPDSILEASTRSSLIAERHLAKTLGGTPIVQRKSLSLAEKQETEKEKIEI